MPDHDVLELIKQADAAITAEDFEALMEFYAEDAILVVQPSQIARGKPQIRKAFEAIAAHFKNALRVEQGQAQVLEGGDTALVIMETLLFAANASGPITRRATYVFKRTEAGSWLCTVDNSYGTDLLNPS
ncbi:MAG: SgcJ/EcaC family oxidoreductase [Pseudomonadota bacterium]